jgi:hypothetical protein
MSEPQREQAALEAYLKLMRNKGATEENLAKRASFIRLMFPLLNGQPLDGAIYREAIDEAMSQRPREEWPFFLALSREYFYFWINDLKSIAALHSNGEYEVEPLSGVVHTDESLKQAWKRLDTERFEVYETWPLQAYRAALREEGADKSVVETREKLVKLLLLDLRNVSEKNGRTYRVAVDSLLVIFKMPETRRLFLTVVREFYYFWIGDPEAASRIVLDRQ